jgi:diacylglycerol kinase (ATP)
VSSARPASADTAATGAAQQRVGAVADFIIIANPTSGRQSAPGLATRVQQLLEQHGKRAELRVTTAPGDAGKFAADAVQQSAPVVIGCGGDGTLQEIATALDGTGTALGILPGGRCNDFAHALGLSKRDAPEHLANVLLAGKLKAIDLGAAGAKRFLTVATLGFDSEVDRFVAERKMWLKGTPAYVYAAIRVLLRYSAPQVKLKGEFGTHEGRVLLAATGNASCYGGAMQIAPGAKLDDGVFQICVVDRVSRLTVLRIMPRVMRGTHVSHPAVTMLSSRYVEIEAPGRPLTICADGEALCQTPCRLEVRPGALRVIVPETA